MRISDEFFSQSLISKEKLQTHSIFEAINGDWVKQVGASAKNILGSRMLLQRCVSCRKVSSPAIVSSIIENYANCRLIEENERHLEYLVKGFDTFKPSMGK